MTAKEYVQQIAKIDIVVKNKSFEIQKAQEIGADAKEIRNERQQLLNTRDSIITDIEKLSTAHYDVLHKVYVQGKTLYEVAAEMDKSYSYITKLHGWALHALNKIINANSAK